MRDTSDTSIRTEQERLARSKMDYRQTVESLDALRFAARSHASRPLGRPPTTNRAWAEALRWLAELAGRGDPFAQIVSAIGMPPLYQTDGEAAAWIYQRALAAMSEPYDDVIRRAGPEPGRPSEWKRVWTLREKILVLAYLTRATHPFNCTAPGYGWALQALARQEGVTLPQWGP